ncbi:MAG: glycosyltransferase, partial [Candidatus Omnitrophota bacterium]
TSGGFGVGPVKKIVSALSGSEIKFQVLVVCGHNESLRQELTEQYKDKDRPVVKVFGFVNFMDELMSVSDIMVAKAGGLISSESIAKGLPLLTISSIPGQESRNCGLLVASGAAIKLGKVERITGIVEMLHNDRARLQAMKDSIKKIARPNTSLEIAKFVLNL